MRKIIYAFGIATFLAMFIFTIATSLTNPFYGMSEAAMAQASTSSSNSGTGMTCYSVASQCYTFGCTYVTMCGNPCVVKKVDSWSSPGQCN